MFGGSPDDDRDRASPGRIIIRAEGNHSTSSFFLYGSTLRVAARVNGSQSGCRAESQSDERERALPAPFRALTDAQSSATRVIHPKPPSPINHESTETESRRQCPEATDEFFIMLLIGLIIRKD